MNKKAVLEQIREEAFNNELKKTGGLTSEILGQYPGSALSLGIGPLIGAIAAASTPTKTTEQMTEQQSKLWSNMLPGVGTYRLLKRIGHSQKQFKDLAKLKEMSELESLKK